MIIIAASVKAQENKSIYGLALGMPHLEGVQLLKKRGMFDRISWDGSVVVGYNSKRCTFFSTKFNKPKICLNVDFKSVRFEKDAPESNWKVASIDYSQQFKDPMDEATLIENLAARFGKLTQVHENEWISGSNTKVYNAFTTSVAFDTSSLAEAKRSTIEELLENRQCQDEFVLVEVRTVNKFGNTFHLDITLEDLELQCRQYLAAKNHRIEKSQEKIDEQLKLN